MIEIKVTTLLFLCTWLLVVQLGLGNGADSLRVRTNHDGDRDVVHVKFTPISKRQVGDSSRFKVVKYVSKDDNENNNENQNNSSSTNPETAESDVNSDKAAGNAKEEEGADKRQQQQQDEDYVMDRPNSDNNARLGEACSSSRPCSGDYVKCQKGVCSCAPNSTPMTGDKAGNCEESYVSDVPLRGPCNRTRRCSGYFTECSSEGICSCMKGYTVSATERDICRERIHIHMDPSTKTDPTMIGVIVGLALMSVTLCVVMRLFAKARFRENRTIFNTANPRLMNVSLKKVKKQMTMSRSHGAHRGSQDSVAMADGAAARHSAMQLNDRGPYMNRPENPILSTSIDEEPTHASSLVFARNGNATT